VIRTDRPGVKIELFSIPQTADLLRKEADIFIFLSFFNPKAQELESTAPSELALLQPRGP
jgi:hypothetical protein